MTVLAYCLQQESMSSSPVILPGTLTLMDLITALCEETEDDALVVAAVRDLFKKGYVRFLKNTTSNKCATKQLTSPL